MPKQGKYLFTVFLILAASLTSACSYTVSPKSVSLPPAAGPSLKGVSVLVINAEKESREFSIPTDRDGRSGFRTKRRIWAEKIVEALAEQLSRRGAEVSSNAPVTIAITVPRITFSETRDKIRFEVRAVATVSTGWTREYAGSASKPAAAVASVSEDADRLAGQAVSDAVHAMLNDGDFVAGLVPKKQK